MNKIIFFLLIFNVIVSCSFNDQSKIWNKEDIEKKTNKDLKVVYKEPKEILKELNPSLELNFTNLTLNKNISDNLNHTGILKYSGNLDEKKSFNFSNFKDINHLNYRPLFLKNGLIFFDNKGSIIRFNESGNVMWKKNYYSKSEKKLNPKLAMAIFGDKLIVVDNVSKFYTININSGELIWSKRNTYPFNSEIKTIDNKFFAIDYKNILRCFKIDNGEECWKVQTEESFTVSNFKFSLIISKDVIIFSNSVGDLTAVDISTGLIIWQLPTHSSAILKETFTLKTSKIVSDNKSIFFSNNKNQFYSIDLNNGIINWKNKINSNVTPIVTNEFIFTVSQSGFLFTIEKKTGNIIKINNLYKNFSKKEKKKLEPIGIKIINNFLYLTNNNGRLMIVSLKSGEIVKEKKISKDIISEPFIYDEHLYIISKNSIKIYY